MIDPAALARKPTIDGDTIRLVPLAERHAEAFFSSLGDPESRSLTGTHRDFTYEQIVRWCASRAEQDDRVDLAIEDRDTGEFLGELALLDADLPNESIGFRIALVPGSVDRGVGTQAVRLTLAHAFDTLGFHRVQLEVYSHNPRALRVYLKCGFVEEGRLRDALLWDGVRHDSIVMGILRPEFERTR